MSEKTEGNQEITVNVQDFLNAVGVLAKGPEMYHTIKSALIKLDISRSTFEKWRKHGQLPDAVIVNGTARYRESDLENMIAHQNPVLLGMAKAQVSMDAARVAASF
jgi:hypothetical protein